MILERGLFCAKVFADDRLKVRRQENVVRVRRDKDIRNRANRSRCAAIFDRDNKLVIFAGQDIVLVIQRERGLPLYARNLNRIAERKALGESFHRFLVRIKHALRRKSDGFHVEDRAALAFVFHGVDGSVRLKLARACFHSSLRRRCELRRNVKARFLHRADREFPCQRACFCNHQRIAEGIDVLAFLDEGIGLAVIIKRRCAFGDGKRRLRAGSIRKNRALANGIAEIRAVCAGCVFLHDLFIMLEYLTLAIRREEPAQEREREHHNEYDESCNGELVTHEALEDQHTRG